MIKSQQPKFIFLLVLLIAAGTSRGQTPVPDSSIAGLYSILAHIDSHPMITSKRADLEAASRRIAEHSSLANPMLMLGVENLPTNSFSFSEEPMTSKVIGVSQDFPFPGKLKSEAEIAAKDTLASNADLDEERNMLARDAKLAYFDIYHMQRVITVYDFHKSIAEELIQLAESKIPQGKATQSQVLNLKLERADIDNQIIEDKTGVQSSKADLEQATGMSGDISITSRLGLPEFAYSIQKLDSIAHEHSPRLQKLRSQAEQDQLRYHRADLEKYPDFRISLDYMQRDALAPNTMANTMNTPMQQSNMISAEVNIELPLNYNNKIGEARSEAEAMQNSKLSEVRALELELHTKLESGLANLAGIRSKYTLLREEIYPIATAALQTSTADYTYDKASLEMAVRAQLDLIHREHDRYELEADYNKTIAEMEFLTGETLVKYTSQNDWK